MQAVLARPPLRVPGGRGLDTFHRSPTLAWSPDTPPPPHVDSLPHHRHVTAGQRKESTWYQYGFDRPQSPLPQRVATGGMVRQFTRHVQRYLGLEPPAASKAGSRRRRGIVVFSRTRNRLILNEATLVDRLRETYNTTVTIVRMENHTFAEQVGARPRKTTRRGLRRLLHCQVPPRCW